MECASPKPGSRRRATDGDGRRRGLLRADLRRGAAQALAACEAARLDVHSHTSTRCSGATARRSRWTSSRDGPASTTRSSCSSSAAPATASRASAAQACRSRCSATGTSQRGGARGRRRGAVPPRPEPVRLLVVAAHDARELRPEPQLPRLLAAAAAATRLRRDRVALIVPHEWPPSDAVRRGIERCHRAARPAAALQGRHRQWQYTHPRACSTAAPARPGANVAAPAVLQDACASAAAPGLDRLHTGLGLIGRWRAHLRLRATMRRHWHAPRPWWGRDVTSIYDGSSTSARLVPG